MDIKIRNMRLTNISRLLLPSESEDSNALSFKTLDIKDGLGIEKLCDDKNHYYVISFIRYSACEEQAYIENAGNRILDLTPEDFKDFKQLANVGLLAVEAANADMINEGED